MKRALNAAFAVALLALALAPVSAIANSGDFNGGVAIGSSYSGVDAASTNGLIIQGNVGIGTSSPASSVDDSTNTDAVALPSGTTSQRPGSPVNGEIRYNSTTPAVEAYVNNAWMSLSAGGSSGPFPPGGRLSLSSTSPVPTGDVTGATTLYYLPWQGELVPIYNGSTWQEFDFGSSGLSLTLNPTEEVAGSVFDIYVLNNSGSPVLCAMNWGGTSSRSTTAGGTGGSANASVTQLNGLWVNNAAIASGNCYNGTTSYAISQNQGTLLGSFYTPTATATTLSSSITSGGTSIPVTAAISGAGLIGVTYYEAIDTGANREYVLVTGGWNGTTQTVTRGQLGTTAIAHSNGAAVAVAGGQTAFQLSPAASSNGAGNLMGLANLYNTVQESSKNLDSNWVTTYSTAAYRIINNSVLNKTYFVQPLALYSIVANIGVFFSNTSSSNYCYAGMSAVNNASGPQVQLGMSGSNAVPVFVQANYSPVLGLNWVAPIEYVDGGTCTLGPGGGVDSFTTVVGQF